MGNVFSMIFSAVSPSLAEKAKLIYRLEDNLKALEDDIIDLKTKSREVQNEVEIQERQGLQPLEGVLLWISRVEDIGSRVDPVLAASSVELERLGLYGFCSNDFRLTYPYAVKVFDLLNEVKRLYSSRPGEVVARRSLPPLMLAVPPRHTIGLEEMLESTWEHLKKDEVGILGLYGMGGVGKTTLLDQINNKYVETREKFYVISIVVSQDLQIGKIQKEIGKRLGIYNTEWEQEKTKKEKASHINKVLRRNRFVLLLDDIWSKVDLEDIGVPLPSKENRSKVVFTTRSKVVCGYMGAHVEMEVKCLKPEIAWNLFKEKVGVNTLESDPTIPELAKIVCGKCKGLPLALTVIGKTMACKKTVIEWQYAIDVLNSNATEYPEIEDDILRILKLSYDYLKGEKVKHCFQYCALFPEDHQIEKDVLVGYLLCEGIINGGEDREKDLRQGYEIINTLVNACLLINDEYRKEVKMHDVVRQMALWIASNFGENKENFVVKTGVGLHQMPEVGDWNGVTRMSLVNNKIRNISVTPECSNLKTLLLQKNKLENISGDYFLSMPKLLVLNLSYNKDLSNLPEEISNLVSLRYLDLEETKLKDLPEGLRKLIQLRHLDLTNVKTLASISVISSLVNLETLHLFRSIYLTLELIEDIKSLKYLKVLSVSIDDFVVLKRLLSIRRVSGCIEGITLEGMEEIKLSFAAAMPRLRFLFIERCSIADKLEDICRIPRAICFQNLTYVILKNVSGIQDLTWLLFAPSLRFLVVVGPSLELQEIISRGKFSGIMKEEGSSMRPFANLQTLMLADLVELKSIYWEPLDFPNLMFFGIENCPNLKRLPLNTESAKRNDFRLHVDEQEWVDSVEWEDKATRDRFWRLAKVGVNISGLVSSL